MYCSIYSHLLDVHCLATEDYIQAIEALVALVALSSPVAFGEARQECKRCLEECVHTRDIARAHRASHRCLY